VSFPRGIADHRRAGGDVSCYNAPRPNNCIVVDRDTWKDDRTTTYPNIRADSHGAPKAYPLPAQLRVSRVIRSQYLHSWPNGSALTDNYRLNIQDDATEVQKRPGAQ
jgi:hypothetical protein